MDTRVVEVKDKPHIFEFGTPGRNNHHKIAYNTVEELVLHLRILSEAGFDVSDARPASYEHDETLGPYRVLKDTNESKGGEEDGKHS